MKIYNTLTKKQEEFIPHQENIVNLYTCGPTVYSYAHIGNLRTYIFEDFIKTIAIFGAYLSDEFDDEYLNTVYKGAFDINEFAVLGDSREAIEKYVERFPLGKGLKLKGLIKRGLKFIEAVEEDFGADVLVY